MSTEQTDLIRFHLTRNRGAATRGKIEDTGLCPVLLSGYNDLSTLRYDYPLVLVEKEAGEEFARPLSRVVDEVLQEIAPRGIDGERLRSHVLQLEMRVRALVLDGTAGSLSELWDLATQELLSGCDGETAATLEDSLSNARRAIRVDGDVVDCDEAIPSVLLRRAWERVNRERASASLAEIDKLVLRLSDVLKADFMKSDEARDPEHLAQAVGGGFNDVFDFAKLSRVLKRDSVSTLSESRRQRIRYVLSVLDSQKFFPALDDSGDRTRREAPYSFAFESCMRAVEAFRERIPEMVELIKAIAVAELEVENRYSEQAHDAFFEHYDETSVVPEDLEFFPTYLVCLRDKDSDVKEKGELLEALSSGLPIKILAQTSDILGESSLGHGRFSLGVRGQLLANMALSLGGAYVLQTASSNLYRMSHRILDGLRNSGPAIFRVYSGSTEIVPALSPYAAAASAMTSRIFPSFSFDPAAGDDWAARFQIEDNPQAEVDWPVERFSYEDAGMQRVTEQVAHTFVDFAASDRRYARHFAEIPDEIDHSGLVPVATYLELDEDAALGKVPYVLMVDEAEILRKLVVDDEMIRAARRCVAMWRGLQELGGIHNSHALQLLEREKGRWELEKEKLQSEAAPQQGREVQEVSRPVSDAEPNPPAQVETPAVEPEVPDADEPSIETPRCTTCDECTDRNSMMFAYDENKQAYIADINAGTYRDLVEAAEACQVCIIHPGVPKNPDEPGLSELIERAAAFN